ncbi:MAG: toll/interleukin-1 receptor domain-containing protein, partial [Rubrivivax sp.]|nr:toll/interleukin-1 receptor domain-containing protein [Rubrivivax sp.]
MNRKDARAPAVFISYRREDSEGYAGRLYKDLAEHFGAGRVFMDVTGIEPGRDFRREIDEQVATCAVLLAVIGRDWVDARDDEGRRKLDDPGDFVRLETVAALRRDIPVVPVLVQGATMPHLDQLPDDLKPLAFRNAVELTHPRWDSDLQLLIKALAPHVADGRSALRPPSVAPHARPGRWLAGTLIAAIALAAAVGGWQFRQRERSRVAQAEEALRQQAQAARERADRAEREHEAALAAERSAR